MVGGRQDGLLRWALALISGRHILRHAFSNQILWSYSLVFTLSPLARTLENYKLLRRGACPINGIGSPRRCIAQPTRSWRFATPRRASHRCPSIPSHHSHLPHAAAAQGCVGDEFAGEREQRMEHFWTLAGRHYSRMVNMVVEESRNMQPCPLFGDGGMRDELLSILLVWSRHW